MKVLRAMVITPSDSGLPADAIVNTFHWKSSTATGVTATDADEITAALQAFWNGFEGRIPAQLVSSPSAVKFYDMEDPEPRLPIFERTFTWTPGTGLTALPSEVAACVSWRAADESGVNPQSRRGRTFMGPLATNAIEVVSGRVQFTAAAITAWVTAADTLGTVETASGDFSLAIYSPTLDATSSLDHATGKVLGGWLDNAPDTQRRRGTQPTSRTLFSS